MSSAIAFSFILQTAFTIEDEREECVCVCVCVDSVCIRLWSVAMFYSRLHFRIVSRSTVFVFITVCFSLRDHLYPAAH